LFHPEMIHICIIKHFIMKAAIEDPCSPASGIAASLRQAAGNVRAIAVHPYPCSAPANIDTAVDLCDSGIMLYSNAEVSVQNL